MPASSYSSRRHPLRTAAQILLVVLVYNAVLVFLTAAGNVVLRGSINPASSVLGDGGQAYMASPGHGTSSSSSAGDAGAGTGAKGQGKHGDTDTIAKPATSDSQSVGVSIATDNHTPKAAAKDAAPNIAKPAPAGAEDKKTDAAVRPGQLLPGESRVKARHAATAAAAAAAAAGTNHDANKRATPAVTTTTTTTSASTTGGLGDKMRSVTDRVSSLHRSTFWTDLYDPANTHVRSLVPGYRNCATIVLAAAVGGSIALAGIVGRSRQVWDFTSTLVIFQLLVGIHFGEYWLPRSLPWYFAHLLGALAMGVLGTKLCLYVESRPVSFTSHGVRGVLADVLPSSRGNGAAADGAGKGEGEGDEQGTELQDVRKQLLQAMEEGRANGEERRDHDA